MNLKRKHLCEIAKKAIERKTGARGFRSIIEGIMLDVMFDLPSRDDIAKCVITEEHGCRKRTPKLSNGRWYRDGNEEQRKVHQQESAYLITKMRDAMVWYVPWRETLLSSLTL